jgi:hypothetical protein
MASRTTNPVRALTRELILVVGSFAPAGTGAPTTVQGKGFTVSRTGVGTFLLTLADKYAALVAATGTLQLLAAANSDVQFGAYDASAKTLVVRTMTAGAAADIAADANNRVHFDLTFRNSSIA